MNHWQGRIFGRWQRRPRRTACPHTREPAAAAHCSTSVVQMDVANSHSFNYRCSGSLFHRCFNSRRRLPSRRFNYRCSGSLSHNFREPPVTFDEFQLPLQRLTVPYQHLLTPPYPIGKVSITAAAAHCPMSSALGLSQTRVHVSITAAAAHCPMTLPAGTLGS